ALAAAFRSAAMIAVTLAFAAAAFSAVFSARISADNVFSSVVVGFFSLPVTQVISAALTVISVR
ncbi:hypothetical protein OLZ13_25995, partial [Escherichia coli]|nr:hypothetical protein [Escherichia coli]